MSEATHTPGPWFVAGSGAHKIAAVTSSTAIYADAPGSANAIAADARLIAAAPEMRQMLKLLTEKGTKQATGLGWNVRLRMARDLIAKIDGGTA